MSKNTTLSLNAKLKLLAQQEAAAKAAKPQRIVPEERARLIRKLASQVKNLRVNSNSWHEANNMLRAIQVEEILLDEAFAAEHAE